MCVCAHVCVCDIFSTNFSGFFEKFNTQNRKKKKLPFHHVHFPSPMNPKQSDLLTKAKEMLKSKTNVFVLVLAR